MEIAIAQSITSQGGVGASHIPVEVPNPTRFYDFSILGDLFVRHDVGAERDYIIAVEDKDNPIVTLNQSTEAWQPYVDVSAGAPKQNGHDFAQFESSQFLFSSEAGFAKDDLVIQIAWRPDPTKRTNNNPRSFFQRTATDSFADCYLTQHSPTDVDIVVYDGTTQHIATTAEGLFPGFDDFHVITYALPINDVANSAIRYNGDTVFSGFGFNPTQATPPADYSVAGAPLFGNPPGGNYLYGYLGWIKIWTGVTLTGLQLHQIDLDAKTYWGIT